MKRLSIPLFLCLSLLIASIASSCRNATETEKETLRREVIEDLTGNILPFWSKYSPDPDGGFYGILNYDGSPKPGAEKGGVLNARLLWTYSAAYRVLGDESYKELADRARDYFVRYFIDPEYGGTYWSLAADGTPSNMDKQTYGVAFGIYGLAEHYRATGDKESLDRAVELYNSLEKYAYDDVNGGYIESFTHDWKTPERYGYDGKGIAAKTMNTHLHVLEAYTNLLRVWPDETLRRQLRSLIDVFLTKVIDTNTWHERLFLTMDWQNLENIDSYGHDMELSWLITEAAEVLHDADVLTEIKQVAINLVNTQMKEGMKIDGSLLYEKEDGEIHKTDLEWWPQSETVVAFVNAWQITGDKRYLEAAGKTWQWIKTYMIDKEFGEWYNAVREDGTPYTKRQKASLWRCPYHNSRMGFELYDRLK